MRIRTLVLALALALTGGLALPGQADAHSRHHRHRPVVVDRGPYWDAGWHGYYGYYGYRAPYRAHRYGRYYGPYDDAYRYRSYRRGRLHFHGHARCYLPHLSIHIGW